MTGAVSTLQILTFVLIAAALVLSAARLILWRRSARGATPAWRVPALIGLQLVAGALLYLTLNPPSVTVSGAVLRVATEGAPPVIATAPGEILLALPEAGPVAGAARIPDLATALRRHPDAARIRIEGQGLPPRDQGPIPAAVEFDPPPTPPGVVALNLPEPSAAGRRFSVSGRIGALRAGTLELLDPAGEVVAQADAAAGQPFTLSATAHAPGQALFALRLKDARGAEVEHIAIPLIVRDRSPARVLVLAGAPNPETKYLRRWAEDAGVDLTLQIELGAGARLGPPPSLTADALSRVDLTVIDDRRWAALSAPGRNALMSAANGGMGLLLRPTGPLSGAVRRDWAALGLPLAGGDEAELRVLASPGAGEDDEPPALAGFGVLPEGAGAIALLRDAEGRSVAGWTGRGRGRVGVWTVADSYALVLAGRPDLHGEIWSALVSTLARPGEAASPRPQGMARRGTRVVLCGLGEGPMRVADPQGRERALLVDPAAGARGCAAYWPEAEGWRTLLDDEDRPAAFYVHDQDAAPSLRQTELRAATLAMTGSAAVQGEPHRVPGSPWPWFAGLLVVLALLWWLERRRGETPGLAQPMS